ncbi:hypothetical protein B0A48_03839 [Cryoendolithus antarcticus]|uniref:F-box domain-containing protein n=1 Tax=Cryoendolithus antarcticus TaxID=1507870 RepID=A0A1V8TH42_9PEZI|nr:hypothetical protein B0A48_03839 [Cryoendolithus antarcticus]
MEMPLAASTEAQLHDACDTALNIVELLEMVLLELPAINIYGVQRVSKLWQTARRTWRLRAQTDIHNCIHYRAIPEYAEQLESDISITSGTFNPLLQLALPPDFHICRVLTVALPTGEISMHSTTARFAAHVTVRKRGLWAESFVTDPPSMAFRVWRRLYQPTKDDYDQEGNMLGRWIIREQGVRIGDVLGVVESTIPEWRIDNMRIGIGALDPLVDLAGVWVERDERGEGSGH